MAFDHNVSIQLLELSLEWLKLPLGAAELWVHLLGIPLVGSGPAQILCTLLDLQLLADLSADLLAVLIQPLLHTGVWKVWVLVQTELLEHWQPVCVTLKKGKKRRWLLLLKSLKRRERWFPTRTWKKGSIFRLLFMRRILQFDLRNWFAGWRSKAEVMTVKAGNSHPAHIWQNEALQDKRREKLYVCERIVNIWHLPSWRGEAASKQRQHLSV